MTKITLVSAAFVIAAAGSAVAATNLLWSGGFTTGTLSAYTLQACPGGVTVVPDPLTGIGNVAKFTVTDTSTPTYCPGQVFSANPSASLLTPRMFNNGDDRFISVSTLFPVGFPSITNWFQFAEFYGAPYGGSPPIGLDVKGNSLGLFRDKTHGYDNPWLAPIKQGTWEKLIVHVKFSDIPTVGFVEIWLNGVRQTFKDGSQRLYYATLVNGINWTGSNSNHLDLDQYRALTPALGSVSIYHGASAVGTTYASIQ